MDFRRGDRFDLEVQFLAGLSTIELSADATGKFGLSSASAGLVALAESWEKQGDGPSTFYRFDLNLNNDSLNALFLGGVSKIFLNAELEYVNSGQTISSAGLAVVVENYVIDPNSSTPLSLSTPEEWLTARGLRYDVEQSLTAVQLQRVIENLGRAHLSWMDYVAWPSISAGVIAAGEVNAHTRDGITVYRFIPNVYLASEDSFYANFDGTTLTNLITSRG